MTDRQTDLLLCLPSGSLLLPPPPLLILLRSLFRLSLADLLQLLLASSLLILQLIACTRTHTARQWRTRKQGKRKRSQHHFKVIFLKTCWHGELPFGSAVENNTLHFKLEFVQHNWPEQEYSVHSKIHSTGSYTQAHKNCPACRERQPQPELKRKRKQAGRT